MKCDTNSPSVDNELVFYTYISRQLQLLSLLFNGYIPLLRLVNIISIIFC